MGTSLVWFEASELLHMDYGLIVDACEFVSLRADQLGRVVAVQRRHADATLSVVSIRNNYLQTFADHPSRRLKPPPAARGSERNSRLAHGKGPGQ